MSTPLSSTVLKAVQLIELLSEQSEPLSVSECATALGMPRATVHRLLSTLGEAGIVVRAEGHGRYELGLRLLEVGSLAPLRRKLGAVSRMPLKKVTELTGHQAHLGVRSGLRLLFLESVRGTRTNLPTSVGQTGWLHATAMGKVLLAYGPPHVLDEIIDTGLPRLTASTITDGATLRAEIARVQADGYAYDHHEGRNEVHCLAAPIRAPSGDLLAAVSVTVLADRQDRAMRAYLAPLRSAVDDIETRLQHPTDTTPPRVTPLHTHRPPIPTNATAS